MKPGDDVMVMNPGLPSYQLTGEVIRMGTSLALVLIERAAFDKYQTWISVTDLEVI